MSEYAERDIVALDKAEGYYIRHVDAMTAEGLHAKSDIAAELAWRDAELDRLRAALGRIAADKVQLNENVPEAYNRVRDHARAALNAEGEG